MGAGLNLAREYYSQCVEKMLRERFPELYRRAAVGLVGEGSECFGFDDEISRDHDFGPGVCIWLRAEDFRTRGQDVQRSYEALPGDFAGYPARQESPRGGGRVGVLEIHEFYARFIGEEQPPASLTRWLFLPEEKLAAATNGAVFWDGSGEFTRIREALLAYYPEDVRLKKIVARAAGMAQSGQYNYGRCMRRGDSVAAALAVSLFLKNALSMVYLLSRRYAPYYKWMYRGLLERAAENDLSEPLRRILPLLGELAVTGEQKKAWAEAETLPTLSLYENRRDRKVELMETICELVVLELRAQDLTDRADSFLETQTYEITRRIRDDTLRGMHVLAG